MRIVGPFAALLVLPSVTAQAQDVGSYQLPPAPTTTPNAQGPVTDGAPPPRVATTTAAPEATPPPVSLPPVSAPPPTASASAVPTRALEPRAAQARPSPVVTSPVPTPVAAETAAIAPPPVASDIPKAATPAVPTQVPALAPAEPGVARWLWIAVALAAVASAGAALVWWRRRPRDVAEPVFERPVVPAKVEPAAEPAPAAITALSLDLEAGRMSATLVNATLAYRLRLEAGAAVNDLVVRGDMTAAHASRPAQEQLGLADAPVLHRITRIEGGERLELTGEIRLPLSAITPIRHGSAALFVPLVRIEATGEIDGKSATLRSAFVIGLEEAPSQARLQPFRLDLGPRIYSDVGRRALTVPTFA